MNMIDHRTLDRVTTPVDLARGLPNEFYTDPEMFAIEREAVFARNWACLGFAKDVAEPGYAKPIEFAGAPLLLVRDRDDTVRVFQNVCRHRGMILVREAGPVRGAIRCPYHSWCYGLDGELKTTPHVGGPGQNTHDNVKRDELGLIEVRSTVWMGMVFVNLSGDAAPFEEYAGDLIERWGEFADKPIHHGGPDSSFSLDVNCNWKLAVENYCEAYHLPWIHPGLNSYSRLEDHYNIVEPGRFSGQGTVVYNPKLDDTGRAFVDFPGLSSKWDTGAEYIALYPNVLLGIHRDHYYCILLDALSHDHTIERVEIFYTTPDMTGPEMADLREKNTVMWRGIFEEDVFVVEGMQAGRHAPGFDGGKFSPVMDEPTHCFHDWVARQYAAT